MKLIDFDKRFARYAAKWMQDNHDKYEDVDQMEMAMPDVYMRWLNKGADWLEGESPGMYFQKFDDAQMLVKWYVAYFMGNVPVPDQLMERIVELGEKTAAGLGAVIKAESLSMEARMGAVSMLREMGSVAMLEEYIAWLGGAREIDELSDNAAESLKQMPGRRVVELCLDAYPGAPVTAQECLLDVLCHFGGDERIFPLALQRLYDTDNKALMASFLAKLGDERAIEPLMGLLKGADIHYLDYIEIKNALQVLGEDVIIDRSFEGDKYYESLKHIE